MVKRKFANSVNKVYIFHCIIYLIFLITSVFLLYYGYKNNHAIMKDFGLAFICSSLLGLLLSICSIIKSCIEQYNKLKNITKQLYERIHYRLQTTSWFISKISDNSFNWNLNTGSYYTTLYKSQNKLNPESSYYYEEGLNKIKKDIKILNNQFNFKNNLINILFYNYSVITDEALEINNRIKYMDNISHSDLCILESITKNVLLWRDSMLTFNNYEMAFSFLINAYTELDNIFKYKKTIQQFFNELFV